MHLLCNKKNENLAKYNNPYYYVYSWAQVIYELDFALVIFFLNGNKLYLIILFKIN